MNFVKFIISIVLIIWSGIQNIIGLLYMVIGHYHRSILSKSEKDYQRAKFMKDGINELGDTVYYWKNVYNFKKRKAGKQNLWVIGNFVFVKICMNQRVHNYKIPYSDLQFAHGYRILSNIFGPLYTFVILIPTIIRNFRYDHFYSKKHTTEAERINYWQKFYVTKLVNKVLMTKPTSKKGRV